MNAQNGTLVRNLQKNWHHTYYAFHEAGHAVVGHVIERCISEVSIAADSTRGYRGYCIFNAFAEDVQGLPQWREGSQNPECTTIMQYWEAVEALAAALFPQGKVSGREAHSIIQQAIDATVTDWRMEGWNIISPFQALDEGYSA